MPSMQEVRNALHTAGVPHVPLVHILSASPNSKRFRGYRMSPTP